MDLTGFLVGAAFGAALVLSGLGDPDKIVGALRLRDFHALRVIAVFVLTGMLGTWFLSLGGWAHFDVKPAMMVSVAIGGALLGIGFGMTGYCPGTGLAAAAGRIDAVVAVLGMFGGALAYVMLYPAVWKPLEAVANAGAKTLPETTDVPAPVWILVLVGGGAFALWRTRPRRSGAFDR